MSWDWWINEKLPNLNKIYKYIELSQFIFNKFSIENKKREVLEIGAGHGLKTYWLHKLFKSLDSIEPNKILYNELNNMIKKNNINNVNTINTSIENFKTTKKYNIILFINCLVFIKNKKKILNKCKTLLEKDGHILILESTNFLKLEKINTDINIKMIDSINTITTNLKIIYYGIVDTGVIYFCKPSFD
jgi:2-polyprenyl-3-methyl-5-hydroxy-6-metoxy-1,4-benzoquinol methylase